MGACFRRNADGPELQSLKKNATQNIEFIGYQTFENWLCYLQQAKALVFPGIEDFGITPVEAQACGTPVIAYARGGALETVRPVDIEQPTGILFNEQSFSSLLETVKIFEEKQHQIEPRFCRRNAERFGIETFKIQFQQLVGQYINVQKERS